LKSFDMDALASIMGGEYVLGAKDLHSKSCYLIYGWLKAGEGDRLVKPGDGHEEILCAVDGPLTIHSPGGVTVLEKGHAVHIKQDESFYISNHSEAPVRYILAGGRQRD
jgi:redox-sensitive bicupin YhaK (pirin superfamily)